MEGDKVEQSDTDWRVLDIIGRVLLIYDPVLFWVLLPAVSAFVSLLPNNIAATIQGFRVVTPCRLLFISIAVTRLVMKITLTNEHTSFAQAFGTRIFRKYCSVTSWSSLFWRGGRACDVDV